MAKRILIDSSHPEETRVVVLAGNRVEDFDFETASRKQLKGNIYLAKITRVEPSLQAAFVDYGGNRHGFLPFSEIHPDYYRIPIADREALLAEEAALRSDAADEAHDDVEIEDQPADAAPENGAYEDGADESASDDGAGPPALSQETAGAVSAESETTESEPSDSAGDPQPGGGEEIGAAAEEDGAESSDLNADFNGDSAAESDGQEPADPEEVVVEQSVDTVGGDEAEEAAMRRTKLLRRYKIQEVIKRRQVILVQVTKEERGNKGAALTTYLSLPGRYCVLMPNTNKGGGISRKISNTSDRRRLKQVLNDLEIPDGIAVIVRTAGSQRTKVEIRRDYEYLLRLWDSIREATLQSTAPALIYEEANLIKRTIRDLYSRDMDEVLVDGDEGYKAAKDFMKSLTPSHAKKVQQYKDREVPLFQSFQVESQLDALHSNTVQLRSGGYLVLNQTEALVAIDVNSGRATRERHIEETALKTNLEAAEEVGRQLKLRDLAGLIVIDFIDMEESRRNREVERRLKDSLKSDRARIQLGRISPFGLLEMSRQRIRPSIFESSTEICPHCAGDGRVRTVESLALQVLRRLEEEGLRESDATIVVTVPTKVALYILNRKRDHLMAIEQRYDFRISIETDDHLETDGFAVERDGVITERRRTAQEDSRSGDSEDGDRKRGRRRSRRSRRKDEDQTATAAEQADETDNEQESEEDSAEGRTIAAEDHDDDRQRKRKRRGKRGGRRRSRRRDEEGESGTPAAEDAKGIEAQAETGDPEPGADGTSETERSAVVGSAGEDQASESPDEAGAEARERGEDKPKRRRSPRQRRGSTKRDSDGAPADTAEAAGTDAEREEKPKRASRRRGSSRGRGNGRKPATGDPQASEQAGEQPPAPAESPADERSATGAGPSPETIVASDPKVVIEPATPAGAASEQAGSTTMEPPAKDADDSDQPKRRGWWNRFI